MKGCWLLALKVALTMQSCNPLLTSNPLCISHSMNQISFVVYLLRLRLRRAKQRAFCRRLCCPFWERCDKHGMVIRALYVLNILTYWQSNIMTMSIMYQESDSSDGSELVRTSYSVHTCRCRFLPLTLLMPFLPFQWANWNEFWNCWMSLGTLEYLLELRFCFRKAGPTGNAGRFELFLLEAHKT